MERGFRHVCFVFVTLFIKRPVCFQHIWISYKQQIHLISPTLGVWYRSVEVNFYYEDNLWLKASRLSLHLSSRALKILLILNFGFEK